MLDRLEDCLRALTDGGVALAFSGGADSALLLAALSRLHERKPFALLALTMQSALQPARDVSQAAQFAQAFGVPHKILTFDPLTLEAVRFNRADRCYHCKRSVFSLFRKEADGAGLKHLLDGTNADDLTVYRPGRKALQEAGVISPLARLGLTKADVRALSEKLGLPSAQKPSSPCLATRFPYDTPLNAGTVRRAGLAEQAVRDMFPDIRDVRLRVHGALARLEVSARDVPAVAAKAQSVAALLKRSGFEFVTLDLEGFRSGCFDGNLKND